MELIDKQKAMQALVDLPPELDALTVQKAIDAIWQVLTEDAVEVIHAHVSIDLLGDCNCSNCGSSIDCTSDYCYCCGAILDEPEVRYS